MSSSSFPPFSSGLEPTLGSKMANMKMENRFVSEKELDANRDESSNSADPNQKPLFEILEEARLKKLVEQEEKFKHQGPAALDDDDVEFLTSKDRELQHQKSVMEAQYRSELETFKQDMDNLVVVSAEEKPISEFSVTSSSVDVGSIGGVPHSEPKTMSVAQNINKSITPPTQVLTNLVFPSKKDATSLSSHAGKRKAFAAPVLPLINPIRVKARKVSDSQEATSPSQLPPSSSLSSASSSVPPSDSGSSSALDFLNSYDDA